MVIYPKLSASNVTPVTLANSTTETIMGTLNIPGGTLVAGSVIEGACIGNLSTYSVGNVGITANLRIGGLAGPAIATLELMATPAQANAPYWFGFHAACVTSGSAATWTGSIHDIDVLTGLAANVDVQTTPVEASSLIEQALVFTLTWGAASTSNTLTTVMTAFDQVV